MTDARSEPLADDVLIRPFRPDDSIVELTDLLHRAYASLAAMGFRYFATHQTEDDTRRRIAGRECYVGVDPGGRIVATVTFRSAQQTDGCPWYDRPEVCSFGQFAVDPGWRGRGIGSQLMDLVERRARETGAAEIALDTAEGAAHLIDMYARRGYRLVGHVRWPDVNYRSVVMSKAVG